MVFAIKIMDTIYIYERSGKVYINPIVENPLEPTGEREFIPEKFNQNKFQEFLKLNSINLSKDKLIDLYEETIKIAVPLSGRKLDDELLRKIRNQRDENGRFFLSKCMYCGNGFGRYETDGIDSYFCSLKCQEEYEIYLKEDEENNWTKEQMEEQ